MVPTYTTNYGNVATISYVYKKIRYNGIYPGSNKIENCIR